MNKYLFLILLVFNSFIYAQDTLEFTHLFGDYLGQTPPGDSAVIFAPGIISLPDGNGSNIVFSPNGSECYFSVSGIYCTRRINNIWTEPAVTPFSLNRNFECPFFSKDGNRLYFQYTNSDNSLDVWMVERTDKGWGEPQVLPSPINSTLNDFGYVETADGTIYINSSRPGSLNQSVDIWRIRRLPDQSLHAENLGKTVNSIYNEICLCVAPDGSYLIFSSDRPGGTGIQNLYICFNKVNEEWTVPVDMEISSANINVAGQHQNTPTLSPDGKYLFFGRHTPRWEPFKFDVYWVSTKVIDDIKKEVFNP